MGAATVGWTPSARIIPGWYAAVSHFELAASAADAEANIRLALLSDAAARPVLDAYGLLPNEDRLSGPGSGLLLPSFVFPARQGRFSLGTRGGTYYAARDEATARAETTYHYAVEIEDAPDALARARAAGTRPRRAMQVVAADVHGAFLDVRRVPDPYGVGDVYHPTDYAAGARLEVRVRPLPLDGVLYRSVRRPDPPSVCVAVYRPRALRNGRVVRRLTYEWRGPGDVAVTETP